MWVVGCTSWGGAPKLHQVHHLEDIQIQEQIHKYTNTNTNTDINTPENKFMWLVGGGLHQLGWCTRMHQVHTAPSGRHTNTTTSTNTDTNTPENTYMWLVGGGLHQLGWCTKAAPGALSRRHTNTGTNTHTYIYKYKHKCR